MTHAPVPWPEGTRWQKRGALLLVAPIGCALATLVGAGQGFVHYWLFWWHLWDAHT